MSKKADYYQILGLSREATAEEVKKAYRQAAMKHHPDRNPGNHEAEESFKAASEAYEVLSDPEKRALYDQYGHAGLRGTDFHPFNDVDDVFSSFGDLFEGFFGFGTSRRAQHRAHRGSDLSHEMEISFEEACFGIEKSIEVARRERCTACQGKGMAAGSSRKQCTSCRGSGQVGRTQGFFTIMTTCSTCRGEGSMITDPCHDCRGEGRVLRKKKLAAKIPPGVDDGMRLVLQGEGEAGEMGGGFGDLYLFLHVSPHPHFRREGDTLYSDEPVSMVEAALGRDREVETIEGKRTIRIPKGSNSGDTMILESLGVPNVRTKKRGDHVVRLVVKTPKNLTRRQEELLKEFASLSGSSTAKKKKGFFS